MWQWHQTPTGAAPYQQELISHYLLFKTNKTTVCCRVFYLLSFFLLFSTRKKGQRWQMYWIMTQLFIQCSLQVKAEIFEHFSCIVEHQAWCTIKCPSSTLERWPLARGRTKYICSSVKDFWQQILERMVFGEGGALRKGPLYMQI